MSRSSGVPICGVHHCMILIMKAKLSYAVVFLFE
uniref:Uncharacterized protein n=1 Tax=Arundo donax TaxID=35708 RepID=A0A0A9HE76_ARUDO